MEDPADLWIRLEGSSYSLDLVRIEEIVGIQHTDDIARAGRESGIERGSLTAIGLENWTNAADQGDRAARNAVSVNERLPFETVPYFWSDWYGHRIQFVGTGDADEVVFVSGSAGEDKFVALLRRGDRLIGAATLNEPRKIMKIRRLIALRCSWEQALDELRLPVRA